MTSRNPARRIWSSGIARWPRVTRVEHGTPWATMMIFPGSGQTLRRFAAQFSAESWADRGVHVIEFPARRSTVYTWRPGPRFPRTKAAWTDLVAMRHVWSALIDADATLKSLPLWLAGHSGGACFAHVAAWYLALDTPVEGVLSNAGWLWPWLAERQRHGQISRLPRRVAFRVGDKDRLFNASKRHSAFDGADVYEQLGCDVARWTVPGRHEWLAQHDDDLAMWMQGV